MKLFEGEHILTTTDGNAIILTSHRIRSTESNAWGGIRKPRRSCWKEVFGFIDNVEAAKHARSY